MPVEIAFEGYRASSYSSARATKNQWQSRVLRIRSRREKKFLQPLQLWVSARAHLFDDLPAAPKPEGSVSYNTDENVRWGWPAVPDIDGAKTAAQNAIELANGTTTRTAIYANKGEFIDEQDKIYARERARLLKNLLAEAKTLGLSPASAEAWALAQMPTANANLLQPLISAAAAGDSSPPPAKE
jgi:capsid protein